MLGQGNWPGFILILCLSMLVKLIGSFNIYSPIPIIKDIVAPEAISEAEGFESGINSTIAITGGLIGAVLLTAFHYIVYLHYLIPSRFFWH